MRSSILSHAASACGLLLLCATLSPSADAQPCDPDDNTRTVLTVDPNGSGPGLYTTIDAAAAVADAVDGPVDICIQPGVYYEAVRPRNGGKGDASRIAYRTFPDQEGSVVVSGLDPLPLGEEPGTADDWVADGAIWRWAWQPRASWETFGSGATAWFPFVYNTDGGGDIFTGPRWVQRRELLVAETGEAPIGSVTDPALFDGHVMQAVGSEQAVRDSAAVWAATPRPADATRGVYGVYFVDEIEPDPEGPASPPTAIYAAFHDNATPAQARPRLAVRERLFEPLKQDEDFGDCGALDTPGFLSVIGIVFRHANNSEQIGAVCPGDAHAVFRDVSVEFTNGTGILTGGHSGTVRPNPQTDTETGSDHEFVAVRANYNGQIGFAGECDRCTLVDSELIGNNWKGYDYRWEAGGSKISFTSGMVVRRVRAFDNVGPGIWFDIYNQDNIVEGNWVRDNDDAGIFIEFYTTNTLVQHNVITGTRRRLGIDPPGTTPASDPFSGTGLWVQNAPFNYFYHNTIVNNEGNGVFVVSDDDGRVKATLYGFPSGWPGMNASFYNNVVVENATLTPANAIPDQGLTTEAHEVQVEDDTFEDVMSNVFDGNLYQVHGTPQENSYNQFEFFIAYNDPEDAPFTTATNDRMLWESRITTPDENQETHIPFGGQSQYGNLGEATNWPAWPSTLEFITADVRESPPIPASLDPHCYSEPGANPDGVLGGSFLDFPAPPTTNCPTPSLNTVHLSGSVALTQALADSFAGQTVYVLPEATLTVQGDVTLGASGTTVIYVLGTFAGDATSSQFTIAAGSELVFRPLSINLYGGGLTITGQGSCLMVEAGATFHLADGQQIVASDGGFIASKGGTYVLGTNAIITLYATAQSPKIDPGTTFTMGDGARLAFYNEVHIDGTAEAPIQISRAPGATRWHSLVVAGDNSSVSHAEVSGGVYNLDVRGEAVSLDHVTSTGGTYGLIVRSGNQIGFPGSRAQPSADVTNSSFMGNTYGVSVTGALSTARISSSTLSNNTKDGLYVSGGDASAFHHNTVANNSRYGVNVVNDASFSTSAGVGAHGAFNTIADNGGYEVYVGETAYASLGQYDGGINPNASYASICNTVADSGLSVVPLVYVSGSRKHAIRARAAWWGGSPHPSQVSGPVDRAYALTSAPVGNAACQQPGGGSSLAASHHPAASARNASSSAKRGLGDLDPATVAQRMTSLRDSLGLHPDGAHAEEVVAELYALYRTDAEDEIGAAALNAAAITAHGNRFIAGLSANARAGSLSAIAAARIALSGEDLVDARTRANALAPLVTDADLALGVLGLEVDLLVAEDQPAAALTALSALEAAEDAIAQADPEFVASDYTPVRQSIELAAEPSTAKTSSTTSASASARFEDALFDPFPNPTSGRLTVPLTLAATSNVTVSVFDALGRRVAVLADGEMAEGAHALRLDARHLASGVYVVQARVDGAAGQTAFAKRLSVVR